MNNVLISVIVPVYNDEKNLPRCIDSILAQTHEDFECLLIDDGSTDNCPVLCDKYAQKDKRIRVYHRKNEGISKSRQFGIDNSKGQYILFIDSDDWVEHSFLNDVYQKLVTDNVDILFMDFFEENAAGKERYISQNKICTDTETILSLVLEGKLFSCLWNVIIKKNIYKQNNIVFTDGINYGEDTLFILEILLNNPTVGYLPGVYYHHSYNHNSFTRKNKKERYKERVKFLNCLSFLLKKYRRDDLCKHNFFPFNDKFEMLSSGVFSGNEYKELFQLSVTPYYRKEAGLYKYFLLTLAEKRAYLPAKFIACFSRYLKSKLF
ncbi:MAG: glycosyltransferase [Treponema sp.]|jgi:glycosyltransferase involved in cell wall biosynthesis|nr:glycosyltransferase [Treponema sp.]